MLARPIVNMSPPSLLPFPRLATADRVASRVSRALLAAKHTTPAAASAQVPRQAVCEQVCQAAGARVVVVCAPAGFGKATALLPSRAQLQARSIDTGWLTLDAGDNDPSRFLACLAQAIDAMIGRDESRHRDTIEIDIDTLRFSLDATIEFLTGRRHLLLPIEDLSRLHRKSEGWVAALWLASVALERREARSDFVARFSGSDQALAEYLAEYLADDVLAAQPPEVRDFLLRTSVLRHLNAALCDALLQRGDSAARLEQLHAANLFLAPIEGETGGYRYHSLFGGFLRAQLAREQPLERPRLHLFASHWYEQQGRPVPAIDHAIESGDIGPLLARHAAALLSQGRMRLLARWFKALPTSLLAMMDRPEEAYALGQECLRHLQQATARFRIAVSASAKLERARKLGLQGNGPASAEELDRADDAAVRSRTRRLMMTAHDIEGIEIGRWRWAIRFGEPARALEQLPAAIAGARERTQIRRGLRLRVLLAMAQYRAADRGAARDTMAAVLRDASLEGFIRLLVDEGEPAGALIRRLLSATDFNDSVHSNPLRMGYLQRLGATLGRALAGTGGGDRPASWADPMNDVTSIAQPDPRPTIEGRLAPTG